MTLIYLFIISRILTSDDLTKRNINMGTTYGAE